MNLKTQLVSIDKAIADLKVLKDKVTSLETLTIAVADQNKLLRKELQSLDAANTTRANEVKAIHEQINKIYARLNKANDKLLDHKAEFDLFVKEVVASYKKKIAKNGKS